MAHFFSLPQRTQTLRATRKAFDLFVAILAPSAVIFLLGICAYRTVDAWWYAPVNVDAGTFLSAAERMKEGWVPGRDFRLGYTPLGIFMLSIAGRIASPEMSSYQCYLTLIFTLQWGCAIIAYFIGAAVTPSKTTRLLAILPALLINQIYEGTFIFLEVFVAFFSLLAVFIISRSTPSITRWGIAGLFVGFAFLSKQYGVAVLPALAIVALCDKSNWQQKLTNATALGMGFSAAVTAYLALFWLFFDSPVHITPLLWRPGYYYHGTQDFSNLNRFTRETFPFLALTPFLFVLPSIRSSRIYRAGFLILIGLGASLLVRTFLHYFWLVIPFVGLLALVILERSRLIGSLLFLTVATAYIYPVTIEHLKTPYFSEHKEMRAEQFTLSREINAVLPPRSKVLLFANPDIMYTANFLPANNFIPAYGFLSNYNVEQLCSMIARAHFLVVDRTNTNYFTPEQKRIENRVGDFFSYIQRQGFTLKAEVRGHVQIWVREISDESANSSQTP